MAPEIEGRACDEEDGLPTFLLTPPFCHFPLVLGVEMVAISHLL